MPLPEIGKTQSQVVIGSRGQGSGQGTGGYQELSLGHVKFEISFETSNGNVKFAIRYMNLEFREKVGAGGRSLSH